MLSASAFAGSADGLRWFPAYGLQDVSDLSCFIDAQPYDLRTSFAHPDGIDPRLLLADNPPLLELNGFGLGYGLDATSLLYQPSPEIPFGDNHDLGWLQDPYLGQYTMPEIQEPNPLGAVGGGETLSVAHTQAARSCSPASSMLSDGTSSLSDSSTGGLSPAPVPSSASNAGPSGSQYGQLVPGLSVGIGPIRRRGRGRPRKDEPPVHQPPPLCAYIDPLTGVPCGKLLNRHHDLPRHMVKHCQEEAALVNAGRLPRERATLLPPDWKHTDELKLPCRFCSATFSRADAVTRHEKREHKHRPRKG
ncbi:hypothetical protein FRC07_002865 [Ceratobasidium sp. 392]|nr:hypothetical protein FRC07_002865 [Ceratobasidium sp. 392]